MIFSIDSIKPIASALRSQGKKIVLVTGFFDLLHEEHINFLHAARSAGDILIVGVESDTRARAVKGAGRPVETQQVRVAKVEPYSDFCLALEDSFDNQEAYESLISAVNPHIYAVSSHTSFLENKKELVEKYGGELKVVHEHNPAVSTSKILASRQNHV